MHGGEIDGGDGGRPRHQPGRSDFQPHRLATIITAAMMLAAAKNGASWAREISWTSRSGELSPSDRRSPRARPTSRPEAWPKSSAYTGQELRTSARRSTCPASGITKERLRPVKERFLEASACRDRGSPAGDRAAAPRRRCAWRSACPSWSFASALISGFTNLPRPCEVRNCSSEGTAGS